MIKHGIKGVVPGGKRVDEVATEWQAALAACGRETELGEDLELVLQVILADTEERAISAASVWFEEQLKVLAPLGRNAVSDPGADLGYLRSGTGTGHRVPACLPYVTWYAMVPGSAVRGSTSSSASASIRSDCRA